MKGLILKELYLIKSFMKQYVLLMAMMTVLSVFMNNITFVATYIIVLSSSMVMSTTSMDEAVSFNKLAVTMPFHTGNLVKAKYSILLLSITGGGVLIGLITMLINMFHGNEEGWLSMQTDGTIIMIALFIAANATALPVMFKVGANKARYTYIIVMLIMGTAIFAAYKISKITGVSIGEALEGREGLLNLAAIILSAVIVLISYFISVRIVQKKEW